MPQYYGIKLKPFLHIITSFFPSCHFYIPNPVLLLTYQYIIGFWDCDESDTTVVMIYLVTNTLDPFWKVWRGPQQFINLAFCSFCFQITVTIKYLHLQNNSCSFSLSWFKPIVGYCACQHGKYSYSNHHFHTQRFSFFNRIYLWSFITLPHRGWKN